MIGIAAPRQPVSITTAQVVSPAIDEALRMFRAHDLEVEPGPMSTVVRGDDEAVFDGLRDAIRSAATQGGFVMIATLSNACPLPGDASRK